MANRYYSGRRQWIAHVDLTRRLIAQPRRKWISGHPFTPALAVGFYCGRFSDKSNFKGKSQSIMSCSSSQIHPNLEMKKSFPNEKARNRRTIVAHLELTNQAGPSVRGCVRIWALACGLAARKTSGMPALLCRVHDFDFRLSGKNFANGCLSSRPSDCDVCRCLGRRQDKNRGVLRPVT